MGLLEFVGNAGSKLFGGDDIDEKAVTEHLLGLGIKVHALSVIADQKQKLVTLVGRVGSLEDKEKLIIATGNVKGVKQVEDRLRLEQPRPEPTAQAEAPAPADSDEHEEPPVEEQPTSQFYTVQSGDTLGGIAKQFYGNAGKYPVIFEANRPMLTDPNKIYPGQMLRIPVAD